MELKIGKRIQDLRKQKGLTQEQVSGGITHASFGGIGLGLFAGISPILSAAVFSVLSAFGVE